MVQKKKAKLKLICIVWVMIHACDCVERAEQNIDDRYRCFVLFVVGFQFIIHTLSSHALNTQLRKKKKEKRLSVHTTYFDYFPRKHCIRSHICTHTFLSSKDLVFETHAQTQHG
jgi:hypothetical protein